MIHYRRDNYEEGGGSVIYQYSAAQIDHAKDHGKFLDRPLRIVGLIVMCLLSAMIGALVGAWWTQ